MNKRLRQVIVDAATFVPFYQEVWSAAGVDARQLTHAADLVKLPIVRKADLLAREPQARLDARFLNKATVQEPTSGSTGQPFSMPIDRRSHLRRRLRFLRGLMSAGYIPGQRLMLITNPPYPQGAHWLRWEYADLRRGAEDVFQNFVRTRPHVLYGPLSSLLLMARRLVESGQRVPAPKVVVSTAEQLREQHRRILRKAFQADIVDFYGMTELGLVAHSRAAHDDYHVFAKHLHLEFVPVGRDTPHERLIVTDLGGGAMPLIRFDTGDLVIRDHSRAGAPIVQFSGREVDCVKRADGGWVSPYEITLALDQVPGLRQYQVAQRADLAIDLYAATTPSQEAVVLENARRVLRKVCGETSVVEVHSRVEHPLQLGQKQRTVRSLAAA